jgi:diguanylate cyclase (GGDEF)-like protein
MCLYSGISICLGFTSTPYIYFLLIYLVTVVFIGSFEIYIRQVDNVTYDHGPRILLGQVLYCAGIFPIWLLLLEEGRTGGLLFAITLLVYTFAYSSLKFAIALNTFVASGYVFCTYIAIYVFEQKGNFKHEVMLMAAYLPVSIVVGQVGSKLAKKKHSVKQLLKEQKATHIQLQETLSKLKEAASTDELTGLLNRRELNSRMEYELTKAQRNKANLSLLMLDLDHFKKVNDTHGHHCGDLVLKYVADCLKQHFRSTDSIARWGGEEFLILMPDTNLDEAEQVSSRALNALEKGMFHYNAHQIKITASGGLCEMNYETDPELALHIADERLYTAKTKGRNQIVLTSDINA